MDFLSQFVSGIGTAFGGEGFGPTGFQQTYRCLPIAFSNHANLEEGNKVILPPSALQILTHLRIEFPMLFSISNSSSDRKTHCGVMEFSAPEGTAFVPQWIMTNLHIESDQMVVFSSATLSKGTYVKFQPHRTKFIEMSSPRAVLEKALRMYACLTVGDTITIVHGVNTFLIDIVEVRPGNAISIIDTDVNVEFEPPKDYVEPSKIPKDQEPENLSSRMYYADDEEKSDADDQKAASATEKKRPSYFDSLGEGRRLNGKSVPTSSATPKATAVPAYTSPSAPTTAAGAESPLAGNRPRMTSVVQGQWRYYYETDAKTHRRRLVKREPVKKSVTGSFSGYGHSMQ